MTQPIREIENLWIPLADGTRLAARLWLPVDAEQNPVPALLEYLPYRKSDGTAVRDSIRHTYLAAHGYAAVRVDMRGSGDSDGILYDEYLPQEQADALEVLEWLEAQPWCTGKVGIFGKSWGGFNALQIAALRPPQLKAIIPIAYTDDRYADDVHYMGGCVLASEMLAWATTMLAYNGRPPDPRHVGDAWREMWLERLEKTPPYAPIWLSHQRRDAYWQHGSVCEDYGAIEAAVFAVGGWQDGYTNAIPRLLDGLSCPKLGLIGPWGHHFPETALPDPAIGFLQESLRFWDYWLKGIDTGIMEEPMLRAYMQDYLAPQPDITAWPGNWVGVPYSVFGNRYSEEGRQRGFDVQGLNLDGKSISSSGADISLAAPYWCSFGYPSEYALDQRADDAGWLSHTSEPLADDLALLGFPEVTLTLTSDQPNAILALRLCDVAPDGTSLLLSWGLLNLCHQNGHDNPQPLTPNEPFTVTAKLNVLGATIPAGHRWRLSLSPSYWPHAWPSPQPVTLTVQGGEIALPLLPEEASGIRPFLPPETNPELPLSRLREPKHGRFHTADPETGEISFGWENDGGRIRFEENGLEMDSYDLDTYTMQPGDPLSAKARCERRINLKRGEWDIHVEAISEMSADATHFHLVDRLIAREANEVVFDKTWRNTILRDHV